MAKTDSCKPEKDRIEELEKRVKELEQRPAGEGKRKKREKDPNRKPSAYNKFVKDTLAKKKKDAGDAYDHKKAFKECAEEWKRQKAADDKGSGGDKGSE